MPRAAKTLDIIRLTTDVEAYLNKEGRL